MIAIVLQFLVSAAVIVAAAICLTRFSDEVAEATGIGRLMAGSILLALATSLPELSVGISAVRLGMPNLPIGNLLGACLFNLLILGLLDLTSRSPRRALSRASAAHALSAAVSVSMLAIVTGSIVLGPRFGDVTLGGIGVGGLMALGAYALGGRMVFMDQRISAEAAAEAVAISGEPLPERPSLKRALAGYVVAAAVIIGVSPFLASSAGEIADRSGLGDTFVGTTLVAFCTTLPELTTSLAAVRMGALDLALGNIFGSNAFNMILVVPLDLVHPGGIFAAVAPTQAVTGIAAILITSVAIMGQLYRVDRRKRFLEPDAALVVALVLAALALIYYLD